MLGSYRKALLEFETLVFSSTIALTAINDYIKRWFLHAVFSQGVRILIAVYFGYFCFVLIIMAWLWIECTVLVCIST